MRFLRYFLFGAALAVSLNLAHAQTLSVQLTWSASAGSTAADPGTIQVYRASGTCAQNPTSGSTYREIASAAPAAGPYLDNTVIDGQTYAYYVTATVPSYATPSAPSVCWSGTVALSAGPAAPTGLTGSVVSDSGTAPAAAVAIRPKPVSVQHR